jgi:hypothetical protein
MIAPERRQASTGAGEQLTLIDPPAFCPTLPKPGSLPYHALKVLSSGKMIDHRDFENLTESWRLAAAIFTLRALGWPVETIEIPSPTDHCPHRVIALYKLEARYSAEVVPSLGRHPNG